MKDLSQHDACSEVTLYVRIFIVKHTTFVLTAMHLHNRRPLILRFLEVRTVLLPPA